MVLITRTELKTPTLKDFVALMKKEGAKHNYASAGAGGTTHLAMESLKQEAAFDMVHVPYKGIAPAMQDMIGGSIDAMIAGASAAIAQMPSGKVTVLAIAGAKRAKALPDVPTYAEAGYPNVVSNLYLALAAPAGTPAVIVNKIAADVAKVMRLETPEWIKRTDNPVVKPVYTTLFGGWEGNWLGWNTAHDVALPGSQEDRLGFLMYPVAETAEGRLDSYAPDSFKYQITAREIGA
jgi:tripartite-type tricarboxylate transporter receptor subunit TctC